MPVRIMRYHVRLFVALAVGLVALLLLPAEWRMSTRLLLGWDVLVVVYLAQSFVEFGQFEMKRVQAVAAQQDEGALVILILIITAAVASLAAIVIELGAARAVHGERPAFLLAAATAALSWTLTHTVFAFRYAHIFYSRGDHGGGLAFPGDDQPNYWDFVYFSFVIGMTFQVSDVQITSKRIRRLVVVHGVVSFVFSIAILALTVNIGANLI